MYIPCRLKAIRQDFKQSPSITVDESSVANKTLTEFTAIRHYQAYKEGAIRMFPCLVVIAV